MKKLAIIFIAIFGMTFAFTSVNAQAPGEVSDQAVTTATIIAPIAIQKTVDLNFGNIVAGSAAGTVTVATNDGRSKTGGVTLPAATLGTVTAAQFDITGLPNATYSITVPSTFNVTGGGDPMAVGTFVTDPTPTGTLDGAGAQTVKVGATLSVNAGQAAGVYTNSTGGLEITVAYN